MFDPFGVMVNEPLRDNLMGYGHPCPAPIANVRTGYCPVPDGDGCGAWHWIPALLTGMTRWGLNAYIP